MWHNTLASCNRRSMGSQLNNLSMRTKKLTESQQKKEKSESVKVQTNNNSMDKMISFTINVCILYRAGSQCQIKNAQSPKS